MRLKLTYNALKEEWTLKELMSIVVQHEVSLKKNETHSLAFVTDQGKCNFCHKIGHKQADCFKFKNWSEKKKKDIGATIHVTNSLQEMTNKRRSSKHEECVYMGDGSKMKVEFFGTIKLSLSLHHGSLCDSSSINSVVGCKHARMNLSSFHVVAQKPRLRDLCCLLKGKMTAKTRNEKIDRYGYVELIHEKFDSLNVFKAFKVKVELQLGKPIKVVKFDRGGEYYGRYDEIGRNPGPFAKFLLECGIDARYTMLGTPQ
ncbi:hypothetical protein CK203_079658 [Vitis vinifera]|uniref:Retrovirus-related Pol polyprotein from transposon TNT 1-94 n=1 Tax=Vitis vinifera TaxID=29760 RepID=A0A438DKU3_VITVI|nr:hypothetical protein CK203_079658 [Vitis vinifera]